MLWLKEEITFEYPVSFEGDVFVPFWEIVIKYSGYPEGLDKTARKINTIKSFRQIWANLFFLTEESLRGSIKVLKIERKSGRQHSFYLQQKALNVQTFVGFDFYVHESWARAVMHAKRQGFTWVEVVTCDHEIPEESFAHDLIGRSWKASIGVK